MHGWRQTYHRLRKSFWKHPMVLLGDGVMWNLVLVRLEMASVQDRCTVSTKCTIGSEIVLDAPDGTPRRRGSSQSSFLSFGDDANLDVRWVHGWRQTYHRLGKSFWTHSMELLGDVGHVESCFGTFGGTCIGAR